MSDECPTPAVLSYASAAVRRVPWGPVWFRPSRRSIVLAALAILAFVWLSRRHEPWTHVRSFATDEVNTPGFTADGLLLTFDGARGANLWDPRTGRHLRTVVPKLRPGQEAAFAMEGGRRVLVLEDNGEPGLVYDARPPPIAPRPPVTVPNPTGWRADMFRVCPGGPYVITRASTIMGRWFQPYGSETLYLWDLREGAKVLTARDMRLLPFPSVAKFSPDGSWILQWRDRPVAGFVLLETQTLREVAKAEYPDARIRDAGFAPAGGRDVFCMVTHSWALRPEGQPATAGDGRHRGAVVRDGAHPAPVQRAGGASRQVRGHELLQPLRRRQDAGAGGSAEAHSAVDGHDRVLGRGDRTIDRDAGDGRAELDLHVHRPG